MSTENISIVMAYFNRLPQFEFTLKKLISFNFKGEIIVADDFSDSEQKASILKDKYTELNIRVITPKLKTMTPSHKLNCAIREAKNEIVIITNPECVWVQNVGEYICSHLREKEYMVFGCLSATEEETNTFNETTDLGSVTGEKWYQHSKIRPNALHWCAAVHKHDLDTYLGGGFDEQFNEGYCYDDNEFIFRVRKHLQVIQVDTPYVIHQYHSRSLEYTGHQQESTRKLALERNRKLFEETKRTYGTVEYKGILPIPRNS